MEEAVQYLDLIRSDSFLHAMLASYENAAGARPRSSVLDYGCGYGWGSYILSGTYSQVTGYDPDAARIGFARGIFARENITFIQDEKMLSGHRYDAVCLFMVLPHVENGRDLLTSLDVYLKPGGTIWISYKSADTAIPPAVQDWSEECGFTRIYGAVRNLSDRESVVEQCYSKHRDEGLPYAL